MKRAFPAQFYQWFKSSASGRRHWLLYSFSPLSHLPLGSLVCYSHLHYSSNPLGPSLRLPKEQEGLEVVMSCTVTFLWPSAFLLPRFGSCSSATCITAGQRWSHLLLLLRLHPCQPSTGKKRITQVWFSSLESCSPSRLELASLFYATSFSKRTCTSSIILNNYLEELAWIIPTTKNILLYQQF